MRCPVSWHEDTAICAGFARTPRSRSWPIFSNVFERSPALQSRQDDRSVLRRSRNGPAIRHSAFTFGRSRPAGCARLASDPGVAAGKLIKLQNRILKRGRGATGGAPLFHFVHMNGRR
jgi:hypothetical protein